MSEQNPDQKLFLVFGGELKNLDSICFNDLENIDFVGAFENEENAKDAWRAKAQATVDNAHMRYFVAPIHKFLDVM